MNAFALTYDMENRLATATSGTAVESYAYDESNHRVEKTMGTNDYLYFYGPSGRLLSIRSVSGTGVTSMVADRVYFGGMLLGSAGASGNFDVSTLTDRLGTAATGYPYGTDLNGSAAGNDQPDFATYTRDGTTGFEYANHRYYSAGMGRFLSVDPYGGSGVTTDPGSWNRFSYAQGDPVNANDSRGLSGCAVDDASCNPALCLGDGVLGGPCNPPQFCWDDSYEYSGGVVPNVTCFGSGQSISAAQQSRLPVVAFKDAFQAFSRAARKLAKMKFSIKCNKDLAAVGTTSALCRTGRRA